VLAYFPNAVIQRCLIHEEWNFKKYLPNKYHLKLRWYFDRFRKAQDLEVAKEIPKELYAFFKIRNAQTTESLLKAGDTFLGLYRLEVSSTLKTTFLNTNIIKNSYRNVRTKIGNDFR
jgi:putative transposase